MTQTDKIRVGEYWVCKSNLIRPELSLDGKRIFNHDFKGISYTNLYRPGTVEYPTPYAIESIFINSDITHINKVVTPPYTIGLTRPIGSLSYDISKFQTIVVAKDVTYKNCKLTFRDTQLDLKKDSLMDIKFIFENCKFENCIFEHNTRRIKVRSDQFSF